MHYQISCSYLITFFSIQANDLFIQIGTTRNRVRGHGKKLTELLKGKVSSHRVVNDWNDLPATVAHSKNINYLKIGVD